MWILLGDLDLVFDVVRDFALWQVLFLELLLVLGLFFLVFEVFILVLVVIVILVLVLVVLDRLLLTFRFFLLLC